MQVLAIIMVQAMYKYKWMNLKNEGRWNGTKIYAGQGVGGMKTKI